MAEAAAKLADGGSEEITVELNGVRQDGSEIRVELSSRNISWNGADAIMTAAVDFTRLRHSEDALDSSRRLLQTVFDTIPLPLFLKDRRHRFLMVNKALADSLGVAPEQAINRTIRDLGFGTDEELDRIEAADEDVFRTGKIVDLAEESITNPDGRRIWRRVVKAPLHDDAGNIVGQHDGAVGVVSSPGQGTTFEIYLRAVNGAQAQPPAGEPEHRTGSGSIMVVDDEENITRLMKQILEGYGYRVAAFNSGREALAVFRRRPGKFRLVIVDQMMPEMGGRELMIEIRRIRPDIPIILGTGFSAVLSYHKPKLLGLNDFFYKPITAAELGEKVQRVLRESQFS